MPDSITVTTGFSVTLGSRDVAMQVAQFLLKNLLYRTDPVLPPVLSTADGGGIFKTWVGDVTVSRGLMEPVYTVAFPRSTHPDGYVISSVIAGEVSKNGGAFRASFVGDMLNRMGNIAAQQALQQQLQGVGTAANAPYSGGGGRPSSGAGRSPTTP